MINRNNNQFTNNDVTPVFRPGQIQTSVAGATVLSQTTVNGVLGQNFSMIPGMSAFQNTHPVEINPNSSLDLTSTRLKTNSSPFISGASSMNSLPPTAMCNQTVYFFDRDPEIFRFVLDFYRTGELHLPSSICGPFVRKELIFWGIDESLIEPCCMPAYMRYDEEKRTKNTLFRDCFEDIDSMQNLVQYSRGLKKWRYRMWLFMDHPSSSLPAKVSQAPNINRICNACNEFKCCRTKLIRHEFCLGLSVSAAQRDNESQVEAINRLRPSS
ncbi:hypothetical protein Ciccas_005970 [Cichlidogyrus casuarinus]|uniref:Potassium channel tetramerisation-type BTB domain-containing protein n=1 Tax=Cichlidogyrus casuarinus TaxID=1844966 RepID=A0ABD2Q7G0_9PLAT